MLHLLRTILVICVINSAVGYSAETGDELIVSVFEEHDKYLTTSQTYALSWVVYEYAAKEAGIKLNAIELNAQGALQRIRSHDIDMFFAAIKSDERAEWAHFSSPLLSDGSSIFALPSNPVSKLENIDLKNSVIGVATNSVQQRLAENLGFEQIYAIAHLPRLYSMLKAGRLDYLFFGASVAEYYCIYQDESKKPGCMKKVSKAYERDNLYVITDQKNQRVIAYMNRIDAKMKELRNSEQVISIFEQFGKSKDFHQRWQARFNHL